MAPRQAPWTRLEWYWRPPSYALAECWLRLDGSWSTSHGWPASSQRVKWRTGLGTVDPGSSNLRMPKKWSTTPIIPTIHRKKHVFWKVLIWKGARITGLTVAFLLVKRTHMTHIRWGYSEISGWDIWSLQHPPSDLPWTWLMVTVRQSQSPFSEML